MRLMSELSLYNPHDVCSGASSIVSEHGSSSIRVYRARVCSSLLGSWLLSPARVSSSRRRTAPPSRTPTSSAGHFSEQLCRCARSLTIRRGLRRGRAGCQPLDNVPPCARLTTNSVRRHAMPAAAAQPELGGNQPCPSARAGASIYARAGGAHQPASQRQPRARVTLGWGGRWWHRATARRWLACSNDFRI
jgi:hypothetical protein